MLTRHQYEYLDSVLRTNPTVRPRTAQYPFHDGHSPQHQQCQVTAMHLEITRGWGAQIGIQWLDKAGCLLPWPHVISWVDEELVDFSYPIIEPKLGFTLTGSDVEMANGLTASTGDHTAKLPTGEWLDPLARQLHEDWFSDLKSFSGSEDARFRPRSRA